MNNTRTFATKELKALAAEVVRLSRLLTRERENLPAAYLNDAGLREAYRTYFLPPNLEKVQVPLRAITLHPGRVLEREKLRVLDLGCGPGTASLGMLKFFEAQKNPPRLDLITVDRVAENLTIARELFSSRLRSSNLNATLKIIRANIEDVGHLAGTPFDLIVLSNVLNELYAHDEERIDKRTTLVKEVLDRLLSSDGSCMIIEPALRETSRELLAVRDGLLEQGVAIYAPCLYQGACPALANPKDWCHDDIPWDPPAAMRELNKLAGLRKDSLKFSYLVLRKDRSRQACLYRANTFRVVSEPLISKGKIEFYFCGEGGRRPSIRLDKDGTSRNEAFGNLRRGDLVGLEGAIDEQKRIKIGKETDVIVQYRAARALSVAEKDSTP